jgi:hypothetical protein
VLGSTFTISGWFSTNTLAGEHIFLSNQFGSTTGWMVGIRGGDVIMDFGNTRAQYTPGSALAVGHTYFIAITQDLDGDLNFGWTAGANHRLSLYDPASDAWQHFDGTQSRATLNLQNLSIGRFTNGGREWDGLVDEIRIYDHALDQEGLNLLIGVPEPGLAALLAAALVPACSRRRRQPSSALRITNPHTS